MMINYCQKSTFKIELSVLIHTCFDKFLFSFKIIRIRDSQQGRRETMRRRFFLYQFYPNYKIKNSKIINCYKINLHG